MKRVRIVALAALAVAIAIAIAGGAALGVRHALAPVDPAAGSVVFEVERGATLRGVARQLEERGIVRDARALVWLGRWRDVAGRLRVGEFSVSPAWPAGEVLRALIEGPVVTYPVVLPEGLTAREIADRLAAERLVDREAFLALVRDPASPKRFGVAGPTLEGYLFPDTYRLPRGLPAEAVVRVLVDEFLQVWSGIAPTARARGLGMREVVVLASIVEKETGVAAERPVIAGVFLNRLKRGMRLESDPTVIYGIPDFDGNLKRDHLEDAANPYNTYKIAGLPPGPIANPGADSLRAVVSPAQTDYLFFVSRNDGSHVFARSYAEHVNNVNRFQKRRSRR